MTFTYELDSYALKIYHMSENKLRTSKLQKLLSARQTDISEIITIAASQLVIIITRVVP